MMGLVAMMVGMAQMMVGMGTPGKGSCCSESDCSCIDFARNLISSPITKGRR